MKSLLKNHHFLGWTLLAVNFALGLVTLYWGAHVDEADNLVVGGLLLRGAALYTDVFSHHFPFPYFWMAGVIALAGKSMFAARFSVLVFQMAAFALALRLSDKPLLVGVAALLWGLVRPFYDGHMVLYTSFAGVSLFVVLVITLAILDETVRPTWKHHLTLAFFMWIAFLAGPLSVYAILVTFLFLLIKHPASGLKTGLLLALGLTLVLAALLLTHTLDAFWQNAILFNAQVYAKYGDANPVRLTDFFTQVFTGLGLPFGQWFDLNPFKPIQIGYAQIDAWFFTGFLYRLGIIVASVLMFNQNKPSPVIASDGRVGREFVEAVSRPSEAIPSSAGGLLRRRSAAPRSDVLPGAYLYLFAAATLLIAKVHFRSQAFILVAMTALAWVALGEVRWGEGRVGGAAAGRTLRVIVVVMSLWLGLRLVQQIYVDRSSLSYEANFRKYERESNRLQKLSCNQPDVLLAHYPEGVYSYWFSGLRPVSKYIFMWPWVAEVGQNEMIADLGGQKSVIVIVDDEIVWDTYNTQDYLRPLLDYLEANYHKVSKDTYISPALFAACPQ
jgi:hypothetical protein